jgi:hypothetical protein
MQKSIRASCIWIQRQEWFSLSPEINELELVDFAGPSVARTIKVLQRVCITLLDSPPDPDLQRVTMSLDRLYELIRTVSGRVTRLHEGQPSGRRAARADQERLQDRERQVDRIYAEWRGGAHKNAWLTVLKQLEGAKDPVAELRWLYDRILQWPDPRLANRLAQELLPHLLAARRLSEALRLTAERLKIDVNFRPLSGADAIRLAELARDGGERPLARSLLEGFDQHYPNDTGQALAQDLVRQLMR